MQVACSRHYLAWHFLVKPNSRIVQMPLPTSAKSGGSWRLGISSVCLLVRCEGHTWLQQGPSCAARPEAGAAGRCPARHSGPLGTLVEAAGRYPMLLCGPGVLGPPSMGLCFSLLSGVPVWPGPSIRLLLCCWWVWGFCMFFIFVGFGFFGLLYYQVHLGKEFDNLQKCLV